VPVHQTAAGRLGLAHMAIAAARVATLAGLLEDRLDVGPAMGGDQLQIIFVGAHREVRTRLDVGDFLLVACGANRIGLPRGPRDQSFMRGFLSARFWVALVARFATVQGVRTGQKGLLHQVALIRFPRRGWRTASPFPLL